MGQCDGHHHIDGDDCAANTCVEAEDDQQRSEHFADEYPVGDETRQAMADHHALDAADAIAHLGNAVQQQQNAQREA
jgi:hypothetical protein